MLLIIEINGFEISLIRRSVQHQYKIYVNLEDFQFFYSVDKPLICDRDDFHVIKHSKHEAQCIRTYFGYQDIKVKLVNIVQMFHILQDNGEKQVADLFGTLMIEYYKNQHPNYYSRMLTQPVTVFVLLQMEVHARGTWEIGQSLDTRAEHVHNSNNTHVRTISNVIESRDHIRSERSENGTQSSRERAIPSSDVTYTKGFLNMIVPFLL